VSLQADLYTIPVEGVDSGNPNLARLIVEHLLQKLDVSV
jgi:hypothetical protein